MTNKELQELLSKYPDDSHIYIVDKETPEMHHWHPFINYDEEFKAIEIRWK